MADWYVSSAAYAAIAAFVPSVAYTVGQIVKPTAPALKAKWVFRCTTAGTASTEPAWTTANNSTISTGGATFTNVTGQSTYGWNAAAGDLPTLLGAVGAVRLAGGDRMFVSSDHTETQSTSTVYGAGGATGSFFGVQILSVNRAGSVPPSAADLTPGAAVTVTGASTTLTIDAPAPVYHYGISYIYTGSFLAQIQINSAALKWHYFDACQFYLNNANSGRIQPGTAANIVLHNSTARFGAASQSFSAAVATNVLEIVWLNTPSAILGTAPTLLFNSITSMTARGVDFSAVTGTLTQYAASTSSVTAKYLFDSCQIAAGVTRLNTGSAVGNRDITELVNCFDGANIFSESYQMAGSVTTETAITLSGGATDNVGAFSHKMVSASSGIDKYSYPLAGFWLDVNNAAIGSAKTATVEIVSSTTLNSDEISLLLEYEGTTGSSLASFVNTMPTALTTPSAVTTSTATWNSLPATPVKQKLQATFTPRTAGRVRAQVRLGKPSTTVYVNPQVTIA